MSFVRCSRDTVSMRDLEWSWSEVRRGPAACRMHRDATAPATRGQDREPGRCPQRFGCDGLVGLSSVLICCRVRQRRQVILAVLSPSRVRPGEVDVPPSSRLPSGLVTRSHSPAWSPRGKGREQTRQQEVPTRTPRMDCRIHRLVTLDSGARGGRGSRLERLVEPRGTGGAVDRACAPMNSGA